MIIDPDRSFLSTLSGEASLTAATGAEAERILEDELQPLSAVFINPAMRGPSGLALIRLAHAERPATPVFVIHDGYRSPFRESELKRLGVHAAVEKPVGVDELRSMIAPVEIDEALERWLLSREDIAAPDPRDDRRRYFPIRAGELLSGTRVLFDLYLRLSSGHYVRALRAGDTFADERLRRYLRKGVAFFYARREDQERLLAACDRMAARAMEDPGAPLAEQVSRTILQGEEAMRFLRLQGVSEAQVRAASSFVGRVEALVRKLDLPGNGRFRPFIEDLATYEHGVAVTLVATLIASSMKLEGARSPGVLGLAALFHDIGLYHLPRELQDEDEERMNEEQRRAYRAHPEIGAQIIESTPGVDPRVAAIVRAHHARRGEGGFPAPAGDAEPQDPLAEVIGVADEFVRLVLRAKGDPTVEPIRVMQEAVLEGFSPLVARGFQEFFFRTLL